MYNIFERVLTGLCFAMSPGSVGFPVSLIKG